MENTFPGALVERINSMEIDGHQAEFVKVGGVEMAKPCGYAVIVDRISHDMPFYRAYLKNAALTGTQIINNPFWWSADDKFFNYALASSSASPFRRPCCCRTRSFRRRSTRSPSATSSTRSTGKASSTTSGFPAFLKPHDGGGWRDVFHVHNER